MSIWQILLLIILICIAIIFVVATIFYLAGLFIAIFISGTTLKEYFGTWKEVFKDIKDLKNDKDL